MFLDAVGVAYSLHLFQNNNGSSANRGIKGIINVTSGNVATFTFNATNGGGSLIINQSSVALISPVPAGGAWYTLELVKTGSGLAIGNATYTVFWDGVSKFSGTNTGAITGTADAAQNLTIGRTSSTTFAYSSNSLIKDMVFITGTLTAGQITSLRNYIARGKETFFSGIQRYLFLLAGQSLIDGSTPSSNPPANLQGPLDAKIFVPTYSATYSITNTFSTLQYGVNQSYNSLTYYGPNLSLAYESSLIVPGKTYISQVARGGIPWYNQAGSDTTWSTLNASGLPRNSVQFQWVQQALRIHKFQLNSTLKIFLYINEGQTDCISSNPDAVGATQPDKNAAVQASIKMNCSNFLKKVIDDFTTAGILVGSSIPLHILIARMVGSFNPSTPNYTLYVNAAIDDIGSNFATDNPSYVGKYNSIATYNTDYMNISVDGTHPNNASQVQQGSDVNTYFSQFY